MRPSAPLLQMEVVFFNTGDLGYLDEDGFLFITGRSKEIIKRGGEMIAPAEVEEELIKHPKIAQVMAFSAPHDVLQETVGVVIVSKPGCTRVGLREIHQFLSQSLHPSKWPFVVVYMDDLPRNQVNKVLRIRLAERLRMPILSDDLPVLSRLFEAQCPPKTARMTDEIPMVTVDKSFEGILSCLNQNCFVREADVVMMDGKILGLVSCMGIARSGLAEFKATLLEQLGKSFHDYLLPQRVVLVLDSLPRKLLDLDVDAALALDASCVDDAYSLSRSEVLVIAAFAKVLRLDESELSQESDFFQLGGTSLTAGMLFSAMSESSCGVIFPIATIYQHRTVSRLAKFIDLQLSQPKAFGSGMSKPAIIPSVTPRGRVQRTTAKLKDSESRPPPMSKGNSSNGVVVPMLVQLVPLIVMEPIRLGIRLASFFVFLDVMTGLFPQSNVGYRYAQLFAAMILVKVFSSVVFPFVGIALKWIILGKLRPGRYSLWGSMYLRWWLANQMVRLWGPGMFHFHASMRLWYLRLLGARIGKNCRIQSGCQISEWDLICIGENCILDSCSIRGYCVEPGILAMHEVEIGDNCSIGLQSQVVPGSKLPAQTSLGPLSSSYEIDDASDSAKELCRGNFPALHWATALFVGQPILLFVKLASKLPWIGFMYFAISQPFFIQVGSQPTVLLILLWFCGSRSLIACLFVLWRVLQMLFLPPSLSLG